MDPDIVALLGGDPGNPVATLANSLRRKRALGELGMATGDPAMAGLGKELTGEAQHGVTEAIQAQHLGLQRDQFQSLEQHRLELEDQGRGRVTQGQERIDQGQARVDAMNQALALKGVRFNPNSGEFENITPLARPPAQPRRTLLPGATGMGQPSPAAAPPPATASPAAALPGAAASPGPAAEPAIGKWQDKALKELGSDFNPSSGRAGEFGKNQTRVNAAKRVLALALDEKGQPRNLNPQQMPELAQSVAGLIGGSSAAQAQTEHLLPKSYSRDVAGVLQYLTNEPHGAGQQAFVQNMVETAQREAQVAQQGIDQVRGQLGAKHQRIIQSNPQAARRVLQGFGWDLGLDGMPVQSAPAPAAAAGANDAAASLRKKYGL